MCSNGELVPQIQVLILSSCSCMDVVVVCVGEFNGVVRWVLEGKKCSPQWEFDFTMLTNDLTPTSHV